VGKRDFPKTLWLPNFPSVEFHTEGPLFFFSLYIRHLSAYNVSFRWELRYFMLNAGKTDTTEASSRYIL